MTVIVDLQVACEASLPEEADFQRWAELALQEVEQACELSIRLVAADESEELNSTYRGKDKPTNVLSFPFDSPIPMEPRLLGDLVICHSVVEQEAEQQHKAVNDHWAHMVIHGCLHLLGYDHIDSDEAEHMEALEVTLLQSLKIENPYLDQENSK
ncbi:rRNA maturation RNase YbeY [Methylophaga sp. 41_12_T18]|nr:rRNA maturation RNase YbeY [Methylophaga sp. 41_12_T18]